MSSPISESMEKILDRFDDAWNGPMPPRIEDHLAAGDPDLRFALLIELVRIDLERRLAAGEWLRMEEAYLQRFPELGAKPSAIATLVKHEFEVRRRNEPDLSPSEYLKRFPQCQTELLAQLPTRDEDREGEQQREIAEIARLASAPMDLDTRSYQLIETQMLGEGGMGKVYRCSDPALGRDLAIKVIQAEYRGLAEAERRFLRESRITGSLQHPCIVPVHNLGRLADGRLHYTMRLVRGRTLADILLGEAGKPERLPYLLTIFEKICQAVAYAHSKRAIHRDLKPRNVMVGRFGEVQVMDWGLAKLLTPDDETPAAEEKTDAVATRIHTESADTPSDLSRLGSGFGTLQYMPSEQARGKWKLVDERADVFALGSILCEMMTGQPAYVGATISKIQDRAERGDVAEALQRLQHCGADPALTTLCRECLSPHPDDRPRDAAVVAKRVADYQAQMQERLRQAELEKAQATLRAAEKRKRRRLQGVLALALLLCVAGAGGCWWWIESDRMARRSEAQRQEQELRASVLAIFQEAEGHQQRSEWAESRMALERAEGQLGKSEQEDLRQRLNQARNDLEFVRRLDEARLVPATTTAIDYAKYGPANRAAFQWYGLDVLELPSDEAGRRILELPSSVREEVLAALFEWINNTTVQTEKEKLRQVLQVADPDPNSRRRQLLTIGPNRGKLIALARDIDVARTPPILLVNLSGLLGGAGDEPEAVALLRRAQLYHPSDFWINYVLALKCGWLPDPQPAEAVRYLTVALAIRPVPSVYVNLGGTLAHQGKHAEAEAAFRKALELKPDYARACSMLGSALAQQGRLTEAEAAHRKAIELDPKDAWAYHSLGWTLAHQEKHAEAEAAYRKAIELDPDLAEAHCNLGGTLRHQGRFMESLAEFKRGDELGSKQANWRYPSRQWVRDAEHFVKIEKKLPAILRGDASPANADESIAFAQMCYLAYEKHYAASARLYAAAFAAEPKFAEDLNQQYRYDAACSAALTAAGQGEDARLMPDKVVTMFRRWTLGWLRDDLAAYAKLAEQNKPDGHKMIQQRLAHWRRDPDLASVRAPSALGHLPENERTAWQTLWRDVDELAKRAAK